jgi:hypothetical protein
MALAGSAYAQLNTFKDGDVISADQMNENLEYLEQQFRGARATTVNYAAGETINEAIENGFSDITVSGTCIENLLFGITNPDFGYSGKLIPQFLKLSGADSSASIKDASNNTDKLIMIQGSATVLIENLTLESGDDGVVSVGNSDLTLNDVIIEGFTARGVYITDSSNLDSYTNLTVKGVGQGIGLSLCGGSFGSFTNATISDVKTGILVCCDTALYDQSFNISANLVGINVRKSKFQKHTNGLGSIEGTSDKAINVDNGIFVSTEGNLEIKNLNGGRGVNFVMSSGSINNLKMPDFNNTGSGWNPALELSAGSGVSISGAEISGSTDGALVSIKDGSITQIEASTLTVGVGSASNAIDAFGSTRLILHNSTISGSVTDDLVNIGQGSTAQIRNSSSISGTATVGGLVSINGSSSAEIRDSTVTLNSGGQAVSVKSSSHLNIRSSTISGTATKELVDVRRVSHVIIDRSTLSQTDSNSPDVRVSKISFLSVFVDSSINSVHCHMKGTVDSDVSIIDLDPNCTEDGNSDTTNNSDIGSLLDLQGSWLTACQADGDSFSTELLEVNETDATITVSIYPDSECTNAEAEFIASISNLSVGESIDFDDGSDGYKFSSIQDSLTITPLNDLMTSQFNSGSFCGLTNWVTNQSNEVMDLTCDFEYPAKDVIQYGAYKILGSNLNLGESSPTGYPSNVDGYPYMKQP